MSLRRGASIRRLLLGVGLFALMVPMLAVMYFQMYDAHLVETTERALIAESALIAEAWREALWRAEGVEPARAPRIQGPHAVDDFFPYEPRANPRGGVLPPEPKPVRSTTHQGEPAWLAGRAVEPLLNRAKLVNLSAVRLLDAEGCVVATTGSQLGDCLDHLPEVRAALDGRYAAVLRERISDERPPALDGISRRGWMRLFTAMPVFADGRVVGVVRMSRTSIDTLEALWPQRRVLAWAVLGCLALTAAVTLFFSRAIVRPVREITAAATAIARGEPRRPLPERGVVPAEVHDLGAALDEMTRQLRERAAYVAEFASNVSHELKTPLTSVRGAAELLREDWREMEDGQRERFLVNIDAAAERMERLVTGLLRLARIDHERAASSETVTLASFLRTLRERYGERVHLTVTPGAPETVDIPPAHLESALCNLLENALRHGGAAPVTVTVRAEGGRLAIDVQDRGPGISEKNRQRVFDRFFTTERDRGGTGLGLPIARAIARGRGGDVTFDTGPEGTTFHLLL